VNFNLIGIHVPRSKSRVDMKAVDTLTYLLAAVKLQYLVPTVPNVVGYHKL
jgi:hypothetical protein